MTEAGEGNYVSLKAFQQLFERSKLSQRQFAAAIGLEERSVGRILLGRRPVRRLVYGAACFAMLRLGHSVDIPPLTASSKRGIGRPRMNLPDPPEAVSKNLASPWSRHLRSKAGFGG